MATLKRVLSMRVTPAEKALLKAAATARDLTLSEYVRQVIRRAL